MNEELIAWIKEYIKNQEHWIDYLNETSQNDHVAFYAGIRQGLMDVLEKIERDNNADQS